MTKGITHHRFGPDDLTKLCSVSDGLFDNPIKPDQAKAFLEDPLHELIIAYDGDLAVGMVSGTVLYHPDKAPAFFINELGTRDSHLRRGIATALMAEIMKVARERGCTGGIWLATEEDNEAAIGFYRTISSEEIRAVVFGWDDALS